MNESIWLVIGFVGQFFFFLRFFVQWLASEKQKQSIVPVYFWYFSICGCSIMFFYALHRSDPVYILGAIGGMIVYARNLYFIKRNKVTM